MTERLYYTDANLLAFSATVVAVERDGHHVVLDRTAFYPTSGGQPFDTGRIGDALVSDVIDEDERIVHVIATPVSFAAGDVVHGVVDAERRFDHMQQHTGQHLLSAHLADAYGWPTVSVHFGASTNTVDVAAANVEPNVLVTIEREVNRIAAESRPVTITFEDAATATGLRKASDRDGMLRIVTIEGIDKSACGGTHVASTGEIGSMLLRRVEKTKGHTRIEFVCGLRAVTRARVDATLLTTVARMFTSAPEDLPSLVDAHQRRVGELERERKLLMTELSRHSAKRHWDATTPNTAGVRWIRLSAVDGPVRDAESLVQALVALGPCVVLAVSPTTGGVMLGAAEGTDMDAGKTLKAALQSVGGKGGGSPRIAQGSIPDRAQLDTIVHALGFSA